MNLSDNSECCNESLCREHGYRSIDFYNDSEMNLEAEKPNLFKCSELEEKSLLNQSKDEMDQHHDGCDYNLQNISDENDKKEQFIPKTFSIEKQSKDPEPRKRIKVEEDKHEIELANMQKTIIQFQDQINEFSEFCENTFTDKELQFCNECKSTWENFIQQLKEERSGDNTDENKGMDNKRELNNYADKQIFDVRHSDLWIGKFSDSDYNFLIDNGMKRNENPHEFMRYNDEALCKFAYKDYRGGEDSFYLLNPYCRGLMR